MSETASERLVRECYSTWSRDYHRDYYGDDAAYPPVHRGLIAELLERSGAGSVLDLSLIHISEPTRLQ